MKFRTDLDTTKAIIAACVMMHNIGVKSRLILPHDGEYVIHNDVPYRMDIQVFENEQGRQKQEQIIKNNF